MGNDGTGVYDLSQPTFPRIQNYNFPNYARYAEPMTIDASGSHIYWYYDRRINTHKLRADGTIVPQRIASPQYENVIGRVKQVSAHPTDDNVQYVSRYNNHSLTKITFTSSNKQAFRQTKTVGRCCYGTSNASTQYFYYPWGIKVDTTNNRVMQTSYYGSSVTAFDLNLNFIKSLGAPPKTRMQGAHEAIKAIVTDSSLTAGVNFGFAY